MRKTHTESPWVAEGWNGLTVNAVNAPINQAGDQVGRATIVLMPGGSYGASLEELQANARLIAAAPDLLAALVWLATERGAGTDKGLLPDGLMNAVNAAIHKAGG
jgi:hypothetical protein